MNKTVLPGALLGVIGGGEHSRMVTLAARRMGYRVAVLSPEAECLAEPFANLALCASLDDVDAVADLARNVAAVAVDVENLPADTAEVAARRVPLRPGRRVMRVTQHRGLQKRYLRRRGFPVLPFVEIGSLRMLHEALQGFKTPAVLKVAQIGCGGRRRFLIHSPLQAEEAWAAIGRRPAVLEKWIDIHRELSVIVAHSSSGEMVTYGPIHNMYRYGVLDASVLPASVPKGVTDRAVQLAREIACRLGAIGVLCVEMFLTDDYELLVNQLVPRPHGSGHLTLNAHATSQCEQLVRTMCGLPLGPADLLCPAATVSLRGELWRDGEPDWTRAFGVPGTHLHLYGKRNPQPGRTMGHITVLAREPRTALARAITAREALRPMSSAGWRAARVFSEGAAKSARVEPAAAG